MSCYLLSQRIAPHSAQWLRYDRCLQKLQRLKAIEPISSETVGSSAQIPRQQKQKAATSSDIYVEGGAKHRVTAIGAFMAKFPVSPELSFVLYHLAHQWKQDRGDGKPGRDPVVLEVALVRVICISRECFCV